MNNDYEYHTTLVCQKGQEQKYYVHYEECTYCYGQTFQTQAQGITGNVLTMAIDFRFAHRDAFNNVLK